MHDSKAIIDQQGYRLNVALAIANGKGELLWAKRASTDGWQFPQGGIDEGESSEQAAYRELYEEVGLARDQVVLIDSIQDWLPYRFPKRVRLQKGHYCLGQKQRWYLFYLTVGEEAIDLNKVSPPEFDNWSWISYWDPVNRIIDFKQEVYKQALQRLSVAHDTLVHRLAAGAGTC